MQFGKNLPQFSARTVAKCILIRGSVIEKNILLQSPPKIFQLNDIENLLSSKSAGSVNNIFNLCWLVCVLNRVQIIRKDKLQHHHDTMSCMKKSKLCFDVTLIVPMSQCLETWQRPYISLPKLIPWFSTPSSIEDSEQV